MSDGTYESLAADLASNQVVMLMGGVDTGKTTLGLMTAKVALTSGKTVAIVDADVGNTTVGPPACVGLKMLNSLDDLEDLQKPDLMHFVGTINPSRLVLQQVVATAAVTNAARARADLVIVDTTAVVSGVAGETLKYHKTELCQPDQVVALQRGGEMEPVVGMLRRFLGVEVTVVPSNPALVPRSPDERAATRQSAFAAALEPPMERWKVRPTVFAPTLPVGLNLDRLQDVLVGVQDQSGACLGLGLLDHDGEVLRVATNAAEGMKGLRLGSIRVRPDTFASELLSLREVMFGV